jgi:hypothetical protein
MHVGGGDPGAEDFQRLISLEFDRVKPGLGGGVDQFLDDCLVPVVVGTDLGDSERRLPRPYPPFLNVNDLHGTSSLRS